MNEQSKNDSTGQQTSPRPTKRRRWKRFALRAGLVFLVILAVVAFLIKDHVRTLQSLRQVPGTNAYVLDYYVDYNLDEIRAHGMDVENVEDSLIDVFFPEPVASIASGVKSYYLEEAIDPIPTGVERCSTIAFRSPAGETFFGRNFDWKHDALLIVQIHQAGVLASVSVIDLHYLNLDREDLEETNLIQRIPLFFAPYYLQDGMNRHGVAVSDMSVEGVKTPYDPAKPSVIHATAMRLILDYASTTDEAIALLKQYNIHFTAATCHLMIADASGKSAVVEFIDGNMEVTLSRESWQVCTNHQICGSTEANSDKTCDRYSTASEQLADLGTAAGTDDVMRVMESVSKENWTMWSSVYNLSARTFRVVYRRHIDDPYVGSLTGSE